MTKRTISTVLAGAAACAALLPATAPAAEPYRSAAFKVQIKGNQVTTWEYHVDRLKDPCGTKIDAYGHQALRFRGDSGRLIVGKPPKGKPIMALASGVVPGPWRTLGDAERSSSWTTTHNEAGCKGDNGGGVRPRREDEDCGRRSGAVLPDLELARKGRVEVGGTTEDWGSEAGTFLPAGSGETLDSAFGDCVFFEGGPDAPEARGELLPSIERLPLNRLLRGKRKRFVIHFGTTKDYREDIFSGRTVVAGKLILTRTKLTARR